MKVVLLVVGKTDEPHITQGINKYAARISKYLPFEFDEIPDIKNVKNMNRANQKEKEGELISRKLLTGDFVVLLDENGKTYNSVDFAKWINGIYISGYKRMVFVIGGPYGFSSSVYKKGNAKISLSEMTFSHQLVRLIFMEQFYRANTILKGEPYHHE